MKITREWAMPNKNTFTIPPIRAFVGRYLSGVSIDPFAGNFSGCTYTNDLNPNTKADDHMKALDFLRRLHKNFVTAGLVVFDPPYSLEQAKRVYENYSGGFSQRDTRSCGHWKEEKDIVNLLLEPGGVFLHFGWHTNGMGKNRGFQVEEILIVHHGGAHHDTLCMAERKL